MKAPKLESERLIYKPVSMEHHSQDYVDWMNDPDVIRYMESGGNYTDEKLRSFLKDVDFVLLIPSADLIVSERSPI